MSELRYNRLTGDWILFAPERAKREMQSHAVRERDPAPAHVGTCPFCPGNETASAPPLLELCDERGWSVRVVPNKFPALEAGEGTLASSEAFPRRAAFGHHEVLIESRRHDDALARMGPDGVERVLSAYRARYRALVVEPRVAHVVIFKNHGVEAGCSQEHPHSQVVAMSVVTPDVRHRLGIAKAHFEQRGECLSCRVLADELQAGDRVILQNQEFVAFIPFAAYSPFHTWIFPRAHQASFGELTDAQLRALAECLHALLVKVRVGLGDPDYNLMLRSAPSAEAADSGWHWYVSVVPRVSRQAGFELGSGMFINSALPETSARALRALPG